MGKETLESRPYPNEHSCRLEDPGKYKKFARKNCHKKHDNKCIDFIFGIISKDESELQAMRYPTKTWTEKAARAHCKDHDGTFEAAKEEDAFYSGSETRALKISPKAIAHAESLIDSGKINTKKNWAFDTKDSHALMKSMGGEWSRYGLCFLGQDDWFAEDNYKE